MDNNKQTFEEYMEKHPCPDTNSFTQSDWECSMWENWQEEQNPQVEKKSECDRLKEENALLIKALEDMIKMYGRERGLLEINSLHPEYSKAKELLNNLKK